MSAREFMWESRAADVENGDISYQDIIEMINEVQNG